MKVLILTDRYPPYDIGGAERIALYHARALVERGDEVTVLTTYPSTRDATPQVEIRDGVRVHRCMPLYPLTRKGVPSFVDKAYEMLAMPWNPQAQNALAKAAAGCEPDVVHAHYIPRISYGAFRRIFPSAIHIVTFHGYQFECPKGGLYRKRGEICSAKPLPCRIFRRQMIHELRDVDHVIAISQFMKARLLQSGFSENKIVYLPNGVPNLTLRPFSPPSKNRTILFVGRATRPKGLLELYQAFRGIQDSTARLEYVGDGEFLEELRRATRDDPRVAILGRQNAEEVAKRYQASRIVVVPSLWHEPMNTVICEAQSWSRPVVATRVGGNEDMICDGQSGFLCPPGDVPALQRVLEKLLADDALTDAIGRGGFEHVSRFSMERHVAAIEELYRSVMAKRAGKITA